MIRVILWSLALPVLLVGAWFGINATDEELSPDARAAMVLPPLPAPSERNGYLDYLALGAVEGAPTHEIAVSALRELNNPQGAKNPFSVPRPKFDRAIPDCNPAVSSCLAVAAAHPGLQALIDGHSAFLRRYRVMREKPEFIELFTPSSPDDEIPAYQDLVHGLRLAQLTAASRFNSGDVPGALDELEREDAFQRRFVAGSRTLVLKMTGNALIERNALFVAELARAMPAAKAAHWPRLEALVRDRTKQELDLVPALTLEQATTARWMQTRNHVRLSDSYYEIARKFLDSDGRPWWDPLAPYLYRPHQSVNLFVKKTKVGLAFAQLPATEFFGRREAVDREIDSLTPGKLTRAIVNPVGHNHPLLENSFLWYYIGRMHSSAGVQTLVRLQVKLRSAGIAKPAEVEAALAGPLGRAHPDPFTGKPMRFDAKTGTIGFETRLETRHLSGSVRPVVERYGRVAVPL